LRQAQGQRAAPQAGGAGQQVGVPQGLVGNVLLQHLDGPIVAEYFPGIHEIRE
jgi:hypothetical protein